MKPAIQSYLDFAIETAVEAGRSTLSHFQTGISADLKQDGTPVTEVDRKVEELIRARIERQYPTHAVVGEEYGVKETQGEVHRWFIDPIDGTKSFMRGVPLYSVLLALEIEGAVQVGVAYFPALGELLAAATGLGCWWNGRRAHVSPVQHLRDGVVTFTDVINFDEYHQQEVWDRVQKSTFYRAGWGDAYGYLLVATGRAELMLEPAVNVWDVAPYPPIFAEAGGYFGDWQGRPTIYSSQVLATTIDLLPEVLEIIGPPSP